MRNAWHTARAHSPASSVLAPACARAVRSAPKTRSDRDGSGIQGASSPALARENPLTFTVAKGHVLWTQGILDAPNRAADGQVREIPGWAESSGDLGGGSDGRGTILYAEI